MKIFVTGAAGQLGRDVMSALAGAGLEAAGSARAPAPDSGLRKLDITRREDVLELLGRERPDGVIHCAAWTAVDAAEEPENRDAVRAVNVLGTRHVAEACRALDCRMLYVSTDYVFDGSGETPWTPEETRFAPLNVYGRSKLDGELAARELTDRLFIVRTSWAFGPAGGNFVRTMLRLGTQGIPIRVVNDQIGTPTYTPDLAALLTAMIRTDRYGIYHARSGGGYVSWYDFAREIFLQAGMEPDLTGVSTEEYGLSRAARPKNSRLDVGKLTAMGFSQLPDWRGALERFFACAGTGGPDGKRR